MFTNLFKQTHIYRRFGESTDYRVIKKKHIYRFKTYLCAYWRKRTSTDLFEGAHPYRLTEYIQYVYLPVGIRTCVQNIRV